MESVTRRGVLRGGLVVGAGLGLSGVLGTTAAQAAPLNDRFRRSVFRPRLGRTFIFGTGASAFRAQLKEVSDQPTEPAGHERRFRLLFQTRTGTTPVSGTYPVRHPGLGTFALFVTPVGAAPGWYEAVVTS